MKRLLLLSSVTLLLAGCSDGVYFKGLNDGDMVSSPLTVKMGVCGMDVQPAGEEVAGKGHHHLIIDGNGCIPAGETVPKDDMHKHFGKGQTETVLNLAPGEHMLTLQFANGLHSSYGESMCKSIRIHVK